MVGWRIKFDTVAHPSYRLWSRSQSKHVLLTCHSPLCLGRPHHSSHSDIGCRRADSNSCTHPAETETQSDQLFLIQLEKTSPTQTTHPRTLSSIPWILSRIVHVNSETRQAAEHVPLKPCNVLPAPIPPLYPSDMIERGGKTTHERYPIKEKVGKQRGSLRPCRTLHQVKVVPFRRAVRNPRIRPTPDARRDIRPGA